MSAGDDLCTDTAEASYKNRCIAKEISDMVYYTEPVKFNGFKVYVALTFIIGDSDTCIINTGRGRGKSQVHTDVLNVRECCQKVTEKDANGVFEFQRKSFISCLPISNTSQFLKL